MNRFQQKSSFFSYFKKINLPLFGFIILLLLFLYGVSSVSTTTRSKQLESLERAVNRSIVQCYAIEGIYPPDMDYLIAHYGLFYDQETYFIDYQPIASNLFPDVTILLRNFEESD